MSQADSHPGVHFLDRYSVNSMCHVIAQRPDLVSAVTHVRSDKADRLHPVNHRQQVLPVTPWSSAVASITERAIKIAARCARADMHA